MAHHELNKVDRFLHTVPRLLTQGFSLTNVSTNIFENATSFHDLQMSALVHQAQDVTWQKAALTGLLICVALYALSVVRLTLEHPGVPLVGNLSIFEPQFSVSWRFFRHAADVLNSGYSQFSDRVWRFTRADTDMLILPPKYVPELRSLPHHIANPTTAHTFNLAGKYTNMNIILKNDLHIRTLQEKLTPNLSQLTRPMQDELAYAVQTDLPECEDRWVAIKPYHTILRLVARISARIFLGIPLCRSDEWLEISTEFTENTFISLVVLRMFPSYCHGVLSYLLPSVWRATNYIRRAKKLLAPEIRRRQALKRENKEVKESMNLLSWMIDIADESQSNAEDLAHLEVVISLASIHTSQMNAVHVLYDLAAHPEYIQILRDEVEEVISQDGPWDSWAKSSFYKLKKMDSFMRESQRLNPPTLLSYHRVMMTDYKLNDGFVLPKGAHIAMPVNSIQNAEDITPNPEEFDPLRYYRLRQREGDAHLHQFATTEQHVLNFGHGKNACPGRFFASLEIKCILVKLLMNYDWRLPAGQGRPANLAAHEFIFPNQEGLLEMRRRKTTDAGRC